MWCLASPSVFAKRAQTDRLAMFSPTHPMQAAQRTFELRFCVLDRALLLLMLALLHSEIVGTTGRVTSENVLAGGSGGGAAPGGHALVPLAGSMSDGSVAALKPNAGGAGAGSVSHPQPVLERQMSK